MITTSYGLYSHHHNWWLPCITYRDPTTIVIRLLPHVQATPQILSTWYSLYSHHHNWWLPCITYRDPTTNAMRYRVTHRFPLLHKTKVVVSRLPGCTTEYDISLHTCVPLQKHHRNRWLPYIRYWDPNAIVISLISYVHATRQMISTWYSLYSHHHNWWLPCITFGDPTTIVVGSLYVSYSVVDPGNRDTTTLVFCNKGNLCVTLHRIAFVVGSLYVIQGNHQLWWWLYEPYDVVIICRVACTYDMRVITIALESQYLI